MLTGPDASHHQGVIDWAAVKRAGHSYAFIKATEGTAYSFTNWFVQNWGPLKASGLVPGVYHFLRSESDPVAQARYFVKTVGDFSGVLAAVDVETGGANGTSRPNAGQARNFATEFRRLVPGHPLLVYTGRWYWVGVLKNPPGSDIGLLWDSKYVTSPSSGQPGTPYGGWTVPTFWQWTSSGSCPGISGACDLNLFDGDRAALLALTGAQGGDDMSAEDVAAVRDDIKRLVQFVTTGQENSLFSSASLPWMKDSITLNEVARPADLVKMPAACADAVVKAVQEYQAAHPGTAIDIATVVAGVKQALRDGTA